MRLPLFSLQMRPQFVMQASPTLGSQSRVSGAAVGSVQRTVQMHGVPNASSSQQKYVLVQPPSTPSATRTTSSSSSVFQQQAASVSLPGTPSTQGPGGTVFRMVPGSAAAGAPSGAKILVVSLASDANSDTSHSVFSNSSVNLVRPDPSEQNFM